MAAELGVKPNIKNNQFNTVVKEGIIEFFMNDEPVRCAKYNFPSQRTSLINKWLEEIKNIRSSNNFHYVIKPSVTENNAALKRISFKQQRTAA